MKVLELKNIWNISDTVTVYTSVDGEYSMIIDGDDELEFTELSEGFDDYKVEGIYKNTEYDCIEVHIERS